MNRETIGIGKGELHIINTKNERIATLEWSGSLWGGKGNFIWHNEEAKDKILAAIDNGKKTLAGQRVSDMFGNVTYVPVWKGFSGMYGGLILTLPSRGMDVDRSTIKWPGGLNEQPEDLDTQ